ncbi:ABC transporter permease [Acuticoccus sediminis]|uniref:ABC transporter permease n=1 Tax=Acuticoccus sediminis TaxID=2184697 RepID=A0A8B2NW82_9HYPH|nr:ABC transporter permease [Acuticoccus sediminis]RAI01774.1 ABC transporter permease [Acuticoccus sediminis]
MISRILWRLYLTAFFVFLLGPVVFIAIYSLNDAVYFQLPMTTFSFRWYEEFFDSRIFMRALQNTVMLAAVVTVLCLLFAVPTAHLIVRGNFRGRELLNNLILSPLIMPGVVTGIAFLSAFGVLDIRDGFFRLTVAMTIFCLPFAVRAISASYHGLNRQAEEAARNLGASRVQTWFKVLLPQLRPGLMAGGVFIFVETVDNFSINVFLADRGSKTLPIAAYEHIRDFDDPTVAAMATLMSLVTIALVALMDRLIGLDRFIGQK